MHKHKAFTIVELLVVILVIAVLVALSVVGYATISSKASRASLQSDLTNNSKKLKLYQAQYGSYPTQLDANYCPSAPNIDTSGQYCLKLSSNNIINNYVGSINNYTLGISSSTNTSTCYQITSTSNPTNTCSAPSGSYAAEQLLNQATWWIDASYSTNGQTISNLGTGGTQLDARNGSTASVDTNDAQYLDYTGTPYVYVPDSGGNYLGVPDDNSLDITGDLDIRMKIALDDWGPASDRNLLYKGQTDFSYSFVLRSRSPGSSSLRLFWSQDGTTQLNLNSSVNLGTTPGGSAIWVRATLDVDNGAGGYEIKFYSAPDSSDEPTSWTQLGSTYVGVGTTSIWSGTSPLGVGASYGGSAPMGGKVYRAILKNGIDGASALDVDSSVLSSGNAGSFVAKTGQTVSIIRSSSGRKSVSAVGPMWLFGTDDYMQVTDNDFVDFNLTDSFSVLSVSRRWNANTGSLVCKKADLSASVGWCNSYYSTTLLGLWLGDGTVNPSGISTLPALGSPGIFIGVRDVTADKLQGFTNGNAGTSSTDTTTVSAYNTSNLRIGALSTGGAVYDGEMYAAAIFRRALTPAEITTISNYYTNRVK